MTTFTQLNGVFREVFDDDSIELTRATTADEISGWDSLSHMNLILAIELLFGIEFTRKEAQNFKNVGDLLDCIERKIGNTRKE